MNVLRSSSIPRDVESGRCAPVGRFSQLHGSAQQQEMLPDPFVEEAAAMSEEEIAELRERILRKLRRLRDRDMPDMIAGLDVRRGARPDGAAGVVTRRRLTRPL